MLICDPWLVDVIVTPQRNLTFHLNNDSYQLHSCRSVMSTLSWTPCRSSSPSNAMIFFLLAALRVPTKASKIFAHLSSLNRTPNFTQVCPSAFLLPSRWISPTSRDTSCWTFIATRSVTKCNSVTCQYYMGIPRNNSKGEGVS